MNNQKTTIYVWQFFKTPEIIEKQIEMYRDDMFSKFPESFSEKDIEEFNAMLTKVIAKLEEEKKNGGCWDDMEGKTSYRYIKEQREMSIKELKFMGVPYTYNNTRIVKGEIDKSAKTWVGYTPVEW